MKDTTTTNLGENFVLEIQAYKHRNAQKDDKIVVTIWLMNTLIEVFTLASHWPVTGHFLCTGIFVSLYLENG